MEKSNDEKTMDILAESKKREDMYNEMSKEKLVDLLVFRDIFETGVGIDEEEHTARLWCYVADETNLKYITNEYPIKHHPLSTPENFFYISNGDVNVRVPESIASLLPDIKYGDEPVKINLSFSFS